MSFSVTFTLGRKYAAPQAKRARYSHAERDLRALTEPVSPDNPFQEFALTAAAGGPAVSQLERSPSLSPIANWTTPQLDEESVSTPFEAGKSWTVRETPVAEPSVVSMQAEGADVDPDILRPNSSLNRRRGGQLRVLRSRGRVSGAQSAARGVETVTQRLPKRKLQLSDLLYG